MTLGFFVLVRIRLKAGFLEPKLPPTSAVTVQIVKCLLLADNQVAPAFVR
jgi:hypothetical protein